MTFRHAFSIVLVGSHSHRTLPIVLNETICWKAEGVAWWICSLGKSQEFTWHSLIPNNTVEILLECICLRNRSFAAGRLTKVWMLSGSCSSIRFFVTALISKYGEKGPRARALTSFTKVIRLVVMTARGKSERKPRAAMAPAEAPDIWAGDGIHGKCSVPKSPVFIIIRACSFKPPFG